MMPDLLCWLSLFCWLRPSLSVLIVPFLHRFGLAALTSRSRRQLREAATVGEGTAALDWMNVACPVSEGGSLPRDSDVSMCAVCCVRKSCVV